MLDFVFQGKTVPTIMEIQKFKPTMTNDHKYIIWEHMLKYSYSSDYILVIYASIGPSSLSFLRYSNVKTVWKNGSS